ncbi:HGGxSTG domain-containing protein [Noviluteimonas gilva]|uniref:HGGxSTG domain-containing protein n=1 Tax=Noviluteimonas gilva TaxID=2682097 RepID=UPI003CCCC862
MTNGYLSKDRAYLASLQRKRRASIRRLDYMPGAAALAIIEARRAMERSGSVAATNSAILDAIVCDWGRLTGLNNQKIEPSMTSSAGAGINRRKRAGAYEFGEGLGPRDTALTCARAQKNALDMPTWADRWLAESREKQARRRVLCGAKRHRDGQPCKALSEPGKKRCRFHGGRSTGPRTPEGKARARANLRRGRGDQKVRGCDPDTGRAQSSG